MFCMKCGTQLQEGAAFCSGCGAPVNVATPPQPEPIVQEQVPPQPEPIVQEQVPPQPEPIVQEQVPPQPEPIVQEQVPPSPQPNVQEQVSPSPEPVVQEQVPPSPQPNVQEPIPPQPGFSQAPPQFGQVPPQGQPYDPSAPQAYGPMTPAKRSPVVPILIAVIAAALIATGVLLYIFVFRSSSGSVEGKYHLAAIELGGLTFDPNIIPSLSNDMTVELKEDGTAVFSYQGKIQEATWKLEGSNLEIYTKDGKKASDYFASAGGSFEYKNGRIYCTMTSGMMSGSTILAKEGDDLSDIEMSTLEDLMKIMGQSGAFN